MPLINWEVELILTLSADCVIIYNNVAEEKPTFTITETNLYVTLSTQYNARLLPQLKSSFKIIIIWSRCRTKPELLSRNTNFLAFEHNDANKHRTNEKIYYLPDVEKKITTLWLMEKKNPFWSTNINNKVTYENIGKLATGQGDDYTTGCLLEYIYFRNYYKMIEIDLSKQQALDADPKATNQFYRKLR